jgi:hypothetical protein
VRISSVGACREWPTSATADSRRAGRQLCETAMRFSGRPSGIAPRDGAPLPAGSSAWCAGRGARAFTRQPYDPTRSFNRRRAESAEIDTPSSLSTKNASPIPT